MPNTTETHVHYLLFPYEDLEATASQGQHNAALAAMAAAPVTPLERYHSEAGAHGTAECYLHTLVYLPPMPDSTIEPVELLIDGERICTMYAGECTSVFHADRDATFDFEVGGSLTAPVEPPSDYLADDLIISPEGLDSYTVSVLESARPWKTSFSHDLTRRAA
jgi:hypothetical protein